MTNLQERRNQLISEAGALIQGKNVDEAKKRAIQDDDVRR
jgi:hypothetical protein